ncbi:hypothetical protein UPYG_G00050000 [Umbra pygmaea]|uniref:Uncharacterized protein n=1 Tax=Umbra pygmaea TaxID=75934 RepID=A0ABD0XRN3_UMBPY
MTRSNCSKILVLLILAFIVCLPDFLTPGVNFRCVPFDPCEYQEVTSQCTSKLNPADQKPVCVDNHGNFRRNRSDSKTIWFLCDTVTDLSGLYGNDSISGGYEEASMMWEGVNVSITLYGLKMERKDEDEEKRKEEGQAEIYCCVQTLPLSTSTNQSQCLLHIHTQGTNHSSTSDLLGPPRDQCFWVISAVVLLLMVLLTTTQIKTHCCIRKPRALLISSIYPDQSAVTLSQLHSPGLLISRIKAFHWTDSLSPIPEEGITEGYTSCAVSEEEEPLQGNHGNQTGFHGE